MNNNDGNGDRNNNIGKGNYNENIGRDYNDSRQTNYYYTLEKPIQPIEYLPKQGTPNFIGREQEFNEIHNHLQQDNYVAISALSGMGGVGKTELAICYARLYKNDYPGGICWVNTKGSNPAAEIVQRFQLHHPNLKIPREIDEKPLNIKEQLDWIWQNWQPPEGRFLLIFDDMSNLDDLRLILPTNNRFRVLLTTRIRHLDANIQEIPLDVLPSDKALELLTKLVGENRVQQELETASKLCKWLGYLPLGVELIWYQQCVSVVKFRLGKNHPDYATSLNNLANLYYNQGKYEQAEPLCLQSLDIRKQQLGVNHPDTASSLNNLANLYYNQGKYEQAEPLYIQALEIVEQILGSDHPRTVKYRRNLENLRREQQQKSEDDSWLGRFKKSFLRR